jgi:hypothetical protein
VTTTKGAAMVVGSVPLASAEDVFRACARELSPFLSAYPDGEVGERRYWTFSLASLIYSKHPDLEAVNTPPGGVVQQPTRDASKEEWNRSWWTFRLREGVTSITFDRLHYAPAAAESYGVFRRLRSEGVIPSHAKFKVCLPATGSAIMGFFARPADWPALSDAYRRAIRAEVARIVEQIPAEDLVIQWDIASEVRDILAGDRPLLPWSPQTSLEEKWQRHLGDMGELSRDIPEDVALGYHFCFGTWGGWPKSHAPDMSVCVRLANEAVVRAGRRVDYVHMPVMPDATAAFLTPLQNLSIGDTKPYLGIVLEDGLEGFERRAKAASRYLTNFGIASYCGWGRESPEEVPRLLAGLRSCAERFTKVSNLTMHD